MVKEEFHINFNPELVKDLEFMKSNHEQNNPVQVLDARPNGRFRGVEPEPRPDIPSGHMPRSISIPFFTNIDMDKKVLRSPAEIKENFKKANVDLDKSILLSCGSGITACDLAFMLFVATGNKYPVFDDSWFGWQTNTPNSPDWQVREEQN